MSYTGKIVRLYRVINALTLQIEESDQQMSRERDSGDTTRQTANNRSSGEHEHRNTTGYVAYISVL